MLLKSIDWFNLNVELELNLEFGDWNSKPHLCKCNNVDSHFQNSRDNGGLEPPLTAPNTSAHQTPQALFNPPRRKPHLPLQIEAPFSVYQSPPSQGSPVYAGAQNPQIGALF